MSQSTTQAIEVREWSANRPRCSWCSQPLDYIDGQACGPCSVYLANNERPDVEAIRKDRERRRRYEEKRRAA